MVEAAGKSGVATAPIVCLALINIGTNGMGADLIGAGKESSVTAASVVGLAFIDVYAGLAITNVACVTVTEGSAHGILTARVHMAAAVVL